MSWTTFEPPPSRHKAKLAAPVTLRVSKAGGRFAPRLSVVVRQALLPELTWWTPGASVNLQVGDGEHLGRLRITAGGGWSLRKASGRGAAQGKPNAPAFSIPDFPAMPAGGLGPVAPAWEVVGDALVITLPWAGQVGATKVDAPCQPPAPVSADDASDRAVARPSKTALQCASVLLKLYNAGGKLKPSDFAHSEQRTLRVAQDCGWTVWDTYGSWWKLTEAGERKLPMKA